VPGIREERETVRCDASGDLDDEEDGVDGKRRPEPPAGQYSQLAGSFVPVIVSMTVVMHTADLPDPVLFFTHLIRFSPHTAAPEKPEYPLGQGHPVNETLIR
jgi:hypothetical protein